MAKRKIKLKKKKISPSYKKYDRYIIRYRSGRIAGTTYTFNDAEALATSINGSVFRNTKYREKFVYSS